MPRDRPPEFNCDPEIERRFRRLLRQQKQRQQDCRTMSHHSEHASVRGGPNSHQQPEAEPDHRQQFIQMGPIGMINDRDRPMRDYAQYDQQHIQTSIARPQIDVVHFEFKPMMFQMLQTIGQFGGSPHEDPHEHLKQFIEICSNFIIPGISEDAFRLKLFPYSLKDRAKSWLNSMEPNSIHTWNELAEKFLSKYFPPIKNARMRHDITSFRQKEFESLFEAWERWKELLRKCPHHGLPVIIQMETFYNGLEPQTRVMLDASAGGVLLNMSYNEACDLIDRIATNSSSWPTERASTQKKTPGVHEISDISALSAQVASLTNMVKQFTSAPTSSVATPKENTAAAIEQAPPGTTSCVYCGGGHLYEECPSNPVSVNYVGYNRNNNPYSNTYNPGWKNHPNFRWNNSNAPAQSAPAPSTPPGFQPQNQQRSNPPASDNSLEGLLRSFISETRTARQAHDISIKSLENQVGQLATALQQRPAGTLPSNTEASPSQRQGKEQVKAISLRSGKDLTEPYELEGTEKGEKNKNEKNSQDAETPGVPTSPTPRLVPEYPPPPFPQRLKKIHEEKQFSKFLDVLKQLHINVPLIEALQQMPNYAKYMGFLTKRRKRKDDIFFLSYYPP